LEKLRLVSIEPLSLSLPIQSAITRGEIPIQLQASLDAEVGDPKLALKLARDKLEDLDFDNLDSAFPEWIQSIRAEMQQFARRVGR